MRWPTTKNVWEIIQEIICRWGIHLISPAGLPQSSAINNFYPDFPIQPGTTGISALRQLLSCVPDALIFDGYQAWTKDPRPDESSSYSYSTQPGNHTILSGEYRDTVTRSRSRVIGRAADGSRILEHAFDWHNLELGVDDLEQSYDPNLQTATRTQERADAILRQNALEAKGGQITVPVNCGQQLYDVITVTDERCGVDSAKYRLHAIRADYDAARRRYNHQLTLGAP